jgi:DNA polymerase-4
MTSRVILHIDMDAFYASIEAMDDPALRGKPVIVGGSVRGVVSAASYEARAFGVHSAMPIAIARKKCPHGIFLPVRMNRYLEVSGQVMHILASYTPLVEQVSIDEAYLDTTGCERLKGKPLTIAQEIKKHIRQEIGLTCSIGVAPNKFLAKIASELEKPDGLTVIEPDGVASFLAALPLSKISGVGKKTQERLNKLGLETATDILKLPEKLVSSMFGKHGARLLSLARGVDEDEVVPHRQAKSLSVERTFSQDTMDPEALRKWLLFQAEELGHRLRRHSLRGKTVILKLKDQEFKVHTRRHTLSYSTSVTSTIYAAAVLLLNSVRISKPLRLIGLGISNLEGSDPQLHLWEKTDEQVSRQDEVDRAVDTLKERYGRDIIRRGSLVDFKP